MINCAIAGEKITCIDKGTWTGTGNVFDSGTTPTMGDVKPDRKQLPADALKAKGQQGAGQGRLQ